VAGAGSTLIACAKHNRAAPLIEIDPRYCDVTIRRWQEWSGEKALNEENRSFKEVSKERQGRLLTDGSRQHQGDCVCPEERHIFT
jgi:DNA modification methylase